MKSMSRIVQAAGSLGVAALLSASPLWGAVTKITPVSPKTVAANGSKVSLAVYFTEEAGTTATIKVDEGSDNPSAMISGLTGNGSPVKITKGKGTGKVSFTVVKNDTALPRTATLTINGVDFTVNQSGQPCKVTITESRALFDFYGGNGSIDVTAPDGCQWSATEAYDWLLLGTASGNGNGQVTYAVDENTGKNRSGKIEVTSPLYVTDGRNTGGKVVPTVKKVHTVTQKERKLTGTVKLGPPTFLENSTQAAKAFQGGGMAVGSASFLSDSLGALGDFTGLGGSSMYAAKPAAMAFGKAMKRLQPVIDRSGKAAVSASASVSASATGTDISSDICTSGNATVSGLKFDADGYIIGASSTIVLSFTNCLVEGMTMNGDLTVKGASINESTGKVAGTFILGQSSSAPLRIVNLDGTMNAYLTLRLSAMAASDPVLATIQANGIIDEINGDGRTLLDMKGFTVDMSIPSSPSGTTSLELNGLLRQSYFTSGDEFVSSLEMKLADFVETRKESYDSILGYYELITVDGTVGVLSSPANSCIDGTFNITTDKVVKAVGENMVDGTVTINGATIQMNSDGSKTITANGETKTFTSADMETLCDLP